MGLQVSFFYKKVPCVLYITVPETLKLSPQEAPLVTPPDHGLPGPASPEQDSAARPSGPGGRPHNTPFPENCRHTKKSQHREQVGLNMPVLFLYDHRPPSGQAAVAQSLIPGDKRGQAHHFNGTAQGREKRDPPPNL